MKSDDIKKQVDDILGHVTDLLGENTNITETLGSSLTKLTMGLSAKGPPKQTRQYTISDMAIAMTNKAADVFIRRELAIHGFDLSKPWGKFRDEMQQATTYFQEVETPAEEQLLVRIPDKNGKYEHFNLKVELDLGNRRMVKIPRELEERLAKSGREAILQQLGIQDVPGKSRVVVYEDMVSDSVVYAVDSLQAPPIVKQPLGVALNSAKTGEGVLVNMGWNTTGMSFENHIEDYLTGIETQVLEEIKMVENSMAELTGIDTTQLGPPQSYNTTTAASYLEAARKLDLKK